MTSNGNNTPDRPATQVPLDAALDLASRLDWYIFPADSSGEKKSHKAGKYSNDRLWGNTKDPDEIRHDFTRWPDANVGVPTGVENRIFVLDVDTVEGHGSDGLASLQRLETENGVLPQTLMSKSPTGSVHRFFKYPDNLSGKIKITSRALDAHYPGIDVKGDGGMVMAPPSVRPGVGVYAWLNGNEIADAPQWLLDMVVVERVVERPSVDRSPDTVGPNAVLVPDLLDEIDPNDLDRSEWFQVGCAVYAELGHQGREVFLPWTSRGSRYDAREDSRQWNDIVDRGHGYNYSYTTLERIHDKVTETDEVRAAMRMVQRWFDNIVATRQSQDKIVLQSFLAEELEQLPVEPVDWHVENYIPCNAVTGLFGDGGTGKDLLSLMLGTSTISDMSWLGQKCKQGRAMYFPVEDDTKELRRRMHYIANHYGIRYADFPSRFKITPMVGKDTVLAVFDQKSGLVKPTHLYFAIKKLIEDFKPALVIVGNRVNIFAVNQNDDAQARQCVQLLNAIAIENSCAVLMPGHVSVAGLAGNTGMSGTVQWSNACRSRLFLTRIKEKTEDGDEPDQDVRLLEVRKANWGPTNQIIKMRWTAGVFIEDAGVVWLPAEVAAQAEADKEFLRMLDLTVNKVSLHPTANNYAPKIFIEDVRCKLKNQRDGKRQLTEAMDRLLTKGIIGTATYGPPSNRREHLIRVVPGGAK